MQHVSTSATGSQAFHANRGESEPRRSDEPFEALLRRILSLALRVADVETLTGKTRLICDELSRLLCRRTTFLIALDERGDVLGASIASQKDKDRSAFEAHLRDAPSQKTRFYSHLKTLSDRQIRDAIFVANSRLYARLKTSGVVVRPPVEVDASEEREEPPPKIIAHRLFDAPTANDDFGAYFVKTSRDGKIVLALHLGVGTEKICADAQELDQLLSALGDLIAHLATLFANEQILRLALEDNVGLRAAYRLSASLVASSADVKREKDARAKLMRLCESLTRSRFCDEAIALTFDSDGRFIDLACAGKPSPELTLEQALSPLATAGKLPDRYLDSLANRAEKISDTFVALDSVISDEGSPLAFPALANAFALLGHRQSESSILLLAPLFNQDAQPFGFLAYCMNAVPSMVEETIRAVESLTKIVETDLQLAALKASSIAEFRRRRELAEQAAAAKLQDALTFSKSLAACSTRKEKLEATLKAICQKAGVSNAMVFLFDKNGDYALAFSGNEHSFNAISQQDLARLNVVEALPNRFALEAMLSCRGFELHGNYCFAKAQVARALEDIATKGSVPSEFQSPELLRENLTRLTTSDETFLLAPIRHRGEMFGYFALDDIRAVNDHANPISRFSEPLALVSFFARELASELMIDRLKDTSALNAQRIALIKDLTDALAESAKQFQATTSLEEKANFVAECLTEKFGFQFATVVFYEDGNRISSAAHRAHSQLANPMLEKRFAKRLRKGLCVPRRALDVVFRDEFKAEPFYACRARDVREACRALASGRAPKENWGASAFKAYASGDERAIVLAPIYDNARRRIGHVALGQLMLLNLGIAIVSLSERMKLVSVLVEQLTLAARDHLATLEKDAANEHLVRSEARYRNLVENVHYGFVIFNERQQIDFVNAALKSMLGYPIDAMKGKTLEALADPSSLAAVQAMQEQVFVGKTQFETEIRLVSSKGEAIPFRASCIPQLVVGQNGELEIEGAFSVLIDLRPQYEIEKKKRQLETIKNNFYAMVVHDMKVPLAAIYGYSEMMKDAVPAQMNADHFQDIMTQIHRSAINITNLIQEILEFSKYESRAVTLELRPNDLTICLELVLEQNQFGLDEKGIKVVREYEPLEKFCFDFTRVARVIGNIVSNAIKFSHRDSQIIASVKKIWRDGQPFALCSVKDFGEGIPESELESIFDAYRQAQSKHGSRGTGLGLSIAKQIVELHGGMIWAESVLGQGATLSFLLPMRQSA